MEPIIQLIDGVLDCSLSRSRSWRLPVAELAVVGEYTASAWGDDHFFVYVSKSGKWHECEAGVENHIPVIEQLADIYGIKIEAKLNHLTTWADVVLWPRAIHGKPLFKFGPAVRLPWWKAVLYCSRTLESISLSDEVNEYLRVLSSQR